MSQKVQDRHQKFSELGIDTLVGMIKLTFVLRSPKGNQIILEVIWADVEIDHHLQFLLWCSTAN